uniref:VWFA domain-containing protein n=1 Tax=Romanomermis culicivorax TaxID=13658 RepID=A0A915J2T0_ROMCU
MAAKLALVPEAASTIFILDETNGIKIIVLFMDGFSDDDMQKAIEQAHEFHIAVIIVRFTSQYFPEKESRLEIIVPRGIQFHDTDKLLVQEIIGRSR